MAILSEQPDSINRVNYDEPVEKSPPLLSVGPLAWIRNNLFSSWLDTMLTLIGTLVIVSAVSSFLVWSINWANWFAITFNMRQFMMGRFDQGQEWRLQILALVIAFIVGVTLAAWSRVSRGAFTAIVIFVLILFVVPIVIQATVPLTESRFTAGNAEIAAGTVTQTPLDQVAFVGRAGEVVEVWVASEFTGSDAELANLFSFSDVSSNTLRNAADNRLEAQARIIEIEALLASDRLTENQRAELTAELETLEVPPPITETYAINAYPVEVAVLDSGTFEPLTRATLTAGGSILTYEIPADGWYILQKSVPESEQSVAVLSALNIYPLTERNFVRSTTNEAGRIEAARVSQFVRFNDNFVLEAPQPRLDEELVPFVNIIENDYRGQRPLDDYTRLFVKPFLNQINVAILSFVVVGTVGYLGAQLADRQFSPYERPRQTSRRFATWLFIVLPVLTFLLVAGVGAFLPQTDARLWGGLLLTMLLTAVGIVGAFPIGVLLALGRRSHLPVVSVFCTMYIELVRGVPLITVLFMMLLFLPLVNPAWAGPDTSVYRAMVAVTAFSAAYLAENVRGGLQSIPPGQEEAAKALGLAGWQVMLYITLPQALRAVIPALVGQFIALFKDTSLVAIVGLTDLTGMANSVATQTEFLGTRRETYIFISIMYFIFSYVMSIVSRRIEESGSGSARRI